MKKLTLVWVLCLVFYIFSFAKTDEVVVFLKEGHVSAQSLSKNYSVKKYHKNRLVIKVPDGLTVEEFIQQLSEESFVSYVLPNYKIKKLLIPNDPYYPQQWYLHSVNVEGAWDITTGSGEVYVAVLDTGIDIHHPDLAGNVWRNDGEFLNVDADNNGIDDGCENSKDDDGNGYVDDCYGFNAVAGKGSAVDDDGHGTHVSGIIGAVGNNQEGIAGINWNVKIVPCKFLDSQGFGDTDTLISCLEYVKTLKSSGVNIVVVNASYGYEAPATELYVDCNQYPLTEKCLMQSISAMFITASGNGGFDFIGDNNDSQVFLPCNFSTILDNVVCVGAVNSKNEKSSFSNYGYHTVNLFAPGGELVESNTCVPEEEILSTFLNGDYACAIGTSQAAPVVSGAVALLMSYLPTLTIPQIKDRLRTTGKNLPSLFGYAESCSIVDVGNLLENTPSPKICLDKPVTLTNGQYAITVEERTFSLEIKNSGSSSLLISKIEFPQSVIVEQDSCSGASLNTFESCNIQLYYPGSSSYTDDLYIYSNDPNYSNLAVTLSFNVTTEQIYTVPEDDEGSGCGGFSVLFLMPIFGVVFFRRRFVKSL